MFVFLGSWDIKGGSCETDLAGNWGAGGSAVVDKPRPQEAAFYRGLGVRGLLPHTASGRHGIALHCIDVPVLFPVWFSACWCPRHWEYSTRQHPGSFYAFFLHSAFISIPLLISCALFFYAWDRLPVLLLIISFFSGLLLKPRGANWYFQQTFL